MAKANILRYMTKWFFFLIIPLLFTQNSKSQVLSYTTDIVGCSGTNRGKVTVMVTGGSPRYNYFIRSGGILGTPLTSKEFTTDTFAIFQNLNQGTYGIIVYHNDAAAGSPWGTFVGAFEFTIQYLGFDPITIVQGLTCYDGNDAELQANPKGGVPPYSYAWSNGDNTQVATGFGQGIHSVTITDQKSCQVVSTILFFKNYYPGYIPDQITVSSVTTGTCQGFSNGTITVTGGGGTGSLHYAIVRVATSDSTYQASNNVFTNLASGTYRVYVIDDNGCTARQVPDAIVDEYALPSPTASNNGPVCVGETLTLSSLPNGMSSYSWSGPSGYTSNQQNPTVSSSATPAMAGLYTVTVTDGNGCLNTANTTVVVNPLPTPTASNNGPVCEGQSLQVFALPNGLTSYTWSGPNTFTSNEQNPEVSPTATTAMAGLYTVTVTDGNSCENTASTTVVVIPAPTANAGPDATVCAGSTYTLNGTATNYSTLLWTSSGTGSFNDPNIEDPIYTPSAADIAAGSVVLTLTAYGNAPCGDATDNMTLTINLSPSANAGPDASICQGSTYALNGTAANYSSLLWTSSGTGSFNNATIEDPVYTPSPADIAAGSVILTLTAYGNVPCGDAADNMTLTIVPAATANAGADATVCAGSSHTLSATATNYSSLLWTSSGTGSFNNATIEDPVYTPSAADIAAGSVVLTLTAYGNVPCGDATDNMTLTINLPPSANAGPDASICQGSTHTLNGTAANYSSLLWTSSGTGSFNNATIEDPVYTPSAADITAGSVILTLTAYGNLPCGDAADNMTLTIVPAATADAGADASTCEGSTYTLSATATNYSSLLWTSSGTGSFNNATIEDPVYTPSAADIAAGSVVLTLTAYGNVPCGDATDNMTLTIVPAATADAGADASTCEGSTYTLSATATNYSSLLWTSSGTGSFNNATIEDPVYTPSAADIAAGSVVLTLTAYGNVPCGDAADNMTLTIVPAATANAGADDVICEGSTYTLDGTAANYSSLLWTSSGTGSFNNATIEDPVYTPGAADIAAGSVILTLTAYGNVPCGDAADNMTLTIVPAATANAGADDFTCEGSPYSLNGTATNYSGLLWTSNGTGSFNDPNIEDPIYTPSAADIAAGSVVLTLTAYGNAPCGNAVDDMTLTIILLPAVSASSNSPVCEGDVLNLASMPNGMTSYSWSGPDGFTSNQQNPTVSSNATLAMAGDYTVTVTDATGCWDFTTITVIVTQAPVVDAGPNDSVCFGDTLFITGASASNYSSLLWTSSSGHNGFSDNSILNPYYVPGSTDQANGQVTLYLTAFGNGPCGTAIDSMILKLPSQIQVSISSISPFVIGPNTEIEICMTYEDHLVVQDLSYFLQAPDGTTIIPLKEAEDPGGMCNFFGGPGSSVDLCFTTGLAIDDTLDLCYGGVPTDISGTYAATGDWSNFYGMNPADGGWSIVILDYLATEGSGNPDGKLTHASITFIDTSTFTNELTTIQFESGIVDISIVEGDGFTPGGVSYAVPLGLRTSCAGTCDALAQVTVTGGTPPYILYDWDDPLIPDESEVMLCAGVYSITVTDAMGCTGSTSVTVISPPEIIFDEITHTDTLVCFNDSTGIITVKASGGTGTLSYMLLPDIPSETTVDSGYFSGLPAGTYTIRVEDVKGCYHDTTLTIYQHSQLVLESAEVTDSVFCTGDINGRIEATASGGTEPYTFILEPGGISNSTGIFTNLGAGNYVVKLTDAYDCDTVISDTLRLGASVPLSIEDVIVVPILCSGDSGRIGVVVRGGFPPYSLSVTGGSNPIPYPYYRLLTLQPDSLTGIDAIIETGHGMDNINLGSYPGIFALAWTWDSEPITVRGLINFELSQIPPGSNVHLGLLSLYAYNSPTDGTHSDLSGSNESLIQRITEDWNENTVTWSTQPAITTLNEVLLPPGGTGLLDFENIDITALVQTMVDDPINNFGLMYRLVTEEYYRKMIFASSDNQDSTLWPKLDIYYHEPGADTLWIDLPAGNYDIVVFDSKGCSVSWPTTISLTEPLPLVLDSLPITPIPDDGCYTDPVGQIRVYVSGGTPPYEYSRDGINYQSDILFDNLTGGNYTIYYRDANGCEGFIDTTMISPPLLLGNPTVTHVEGDNLGSILLNPTGGTPFPPPDEYRYSIDGGPLGTNPLFDNLTAGTYLVHVEDANGCVWEEYITIVQLDLDVTVVAVDADCYGEPSGVIRITINNNDGTPPYDIYYAVTGNPLELVYENITETFRTIPSVYAGTYDIRVEDDNSRRFDTTVTVSSPPPINFGVSSTQVTCHEYTLEGGTPSDGGIAINNTSGGVGNFTYTWNDIGEAGPTRTGLTTGLYVVTVTDGNGCEVIDSTVLIAQDTINAAINLAYLDPNRALNDDEILGYPSSLDDTLCYLSTWELYATYNDIPIETIEWAPDTVLDDPTDYDQEEVSITMRYPLHLRLTITNENCMDYDEINLYMFDTVGISIETDAYRVGDSIFDPEGKPLTLFASEGFIAYEWLANDEFDDEELQNPVLTPYADQTIIVIGTTPERCFEWDTAYIVIQRPIGEIFDVFTPNDDGFNDYWIIPNALQYPDIEVIIFNRWGQQIFYSKPYGIDEYHTWDGKSQKNGKDLPIGSYYYIIKPNDGEQGPISGTVTIVR